MSGREREGKYNMRVKYVIIHPLMYPLVVVLTITVAVIRYS